MDALANGFFFVVLVLIELLIFRSSWADSQKWFAGTLLLVFLLFIISLPTKK